MKSVYLALPLLVACAAPPVPEAHDPLAWTLVVDHACSHEEHANAVEAARAWELALEEACPIVFSVEEADVPAFDAPLTWREHAIEVTCGDARPAGTDGYARWNSSIGTARVTISRDSIQRSYRHELGHALGLADGGDGIMSVSWSPTIARGDVELVAAKWCAGKTNGAPL